MGGGFSSSRANLFALLLHSSLECLLFIFRPVGDLTTIVSRAIKTAIELPVMHVVIGQNVE